METQLLREASLQVEVNEVLPAFFCRTCENKLRFAFEFQQLLRKSEEIIRQCFWSVDREGKIEVTKESGLDCDTQSGNCDEEIPSEDAGSSERTKRQKKEAPRLAQFSLETVEEAIRETRESFFSNVICIQCGFKSSNMRSLSVHMTHLHKELKERWCSICNVEVPDLDEHIKESHLNRDLRCKFCGKVFKARAHLVEHLRSHGNIRPFKCDICEYSFVSSRHLSSHLNTHSGNKPYKCPICHKHFIQMSSLKSHVKNHKDANSSQETVPLQKTQDDPKEATSANSDSYTSTANSLLEPQNFCNECHKRVRSLKNHTAKCHPTDGAAAAQVTVSFLCSTCGKQCRNQTKLNVHMRTHTGELPYKCTFCDRRMASRNHLVVHERIHTGEKPHVCNICGKAFSQSSILNTHMRIHTGRPEKCELCQKRFCRPGQLKLHMRKHTGEKPFMCSACGQGFTQRSHLVDHEKIHTDERPFQCEYCFKAFKQKSTLKTHLQIHLNEKPFTCSECTYASRQSYSLTQHMKLHEVDAPRPHICSLCEGSFNTVARLRSHIKNIHHINDIPVISLE